MALDGFRDLFSCGLFARNWALLWHDAIRQFVQRAFFSDSYLPGSVFFGLIISRASPPVDRLIARIMCLCRWCHLGFGWAKGATMTGFQHFFNEIWREGKSKCKMGCVEMSLLFDDYRPCSCWFIRCISMSLLTSSGDFRDFSRYGWVWSRHI